jgi:hypothetical protein
MGIGVLGIGPVGFGLMVAAGSMSAPALRTTALAVASLAVSAGVLAKFVFNWRVYHADSKVVGVVVYAAAAGLLACYVWMGFDHRFEATHPLDPGSLVRSSLQIACLLWGAGEAFGYWLKMRRRVRLGLADPVVTNRFLMWAIGAFAAGWGTAVGTVAGIVTGQGTAPQGGWTMVSSSLHGLVAAIAIALAFIPPAFYVRYIRARAERHLAADFR